MTSRTAFHNAWLRLTYQSQQLGWPVYVALLLLIVSAVMVVKLVVNYQDRQLLQQQVVELRQSKPAKKTENADPYDRVARFYAALPAKNTANQTIANVLNATEVFGLTLDRSAYTTQVIPQSKMLLYLIKLPITGTYLDIRQFITTVMNQHPSIALSDIHFSRDSLSTEQLQTDIEFTLYTKDMN